MNNILNNSNISIIIYNSIANLEKCELNICSIGITMCKTIILAELHIIT